MFNFVSNGMMRDALWGLVGRAVGVDRGWVAHAGCGALVSAASNSLLIGAVEKLVMVVILVTRSETSCP